MHPVTNPSHRIARLALASSLAVIGAADAQWSYANLNPDGFDLSGIWSIDENQQGGESWAGSRPHASLWSGSAESFIDLDPGIGQGSSVRGVGGGLQVGLVYRPNSENHAALWRGTADSYIDLNPPGWVMSQANATDGQRQGGWVADDPSQLLAALWSGTPESLVTLNPAGANNSSITSMNGDVQGGFAGFGTTVHAGFWRGGLMNGPPSPRCRGLAHERRDAGPASRRCPLLGRR